jgi:hypothetical protein
MYRCFDPGPGVSHRLDPSLEARHRHPLPQAIDTVVPLSSYSSSPKHCHATAVDLDPGLPRYQALNSFSS